MNTMFIVAGFIVLFVGGLVYTFVPYTTTMHYNMQSNEHTTEYTTTTTTTGNSPLGAAVMFIGFTIVVVGLFYKPEVAKAAEVD
jgi:flagellin-like protein